MERKRYGKKRYNSGCLSQLCPFLFMKILSNRKAPSWLAKGGRSILIVISFSASSKSRELYLCLTSYVSTKESTLFILAPELGLYRKRVNHVFWHL
jgi:hypothetical protein